MSIEARQKPRVEDRRQRGLARLGPNFGTPQKSLSTPPITVAISAIKVKTRLLADGRIAQRITEMGSGR